MTLSSERKGEIALIFVKAIIREKGFKVSESSNRDFQNRARRLGIPEEELFTFLNEEIQPLLHEMITKAFTLKKRKKQRNKSQS